MLKAKSLTLLYVTKRIFWFSPSRINEPFSRFKKLFLLFDEFSLYRIDRVSSEQLPKITKHYLELKDSFNLLAKILSTHFPLWNDPKSLDMFSYFIIMYRGSVLLKFFLTEWMINYLNSEFWPLKIQTLLSLRLLMILFISWSLPWQSLMDL